MSGGGEYEPKDSRHVQGTKGDPAKSWREQEDARSGRGEYEPRDQRNVQGSASTPDGRWTNDEDKTPRGVSQERPMDAHDAAKAKAEKSGVD